MAYTNYAVTQPTLTSLPYAMQNAGVFTTQQARSNDTQLNAGDTLVVVVASGAVPTGVTVNGAGGTAMSLARSGNNQSIWYYYNNTGSAISINYLNNVGPTATWASSPGYAVMTVFSVTGASGAPTVGTGVTGSTTTATSRIAVTPPNAPSPAALQVTCWASVSPSSSANTVLVVDTASPASLGVKQYFNAYGTSYGYGATLVATNEGEATSTSGASVSVTQTHTTAVALTYDAVTLMFPAGTTQLDDNMVRITPTGPMLNDQNDLVLPFYDIDTIEGISALDITNSADAIDGAHGTYIGAKFASGKTIVIDGTIYSSSPFDESLVDNLKTVVMPNGDGTTKDLFFCPPGKTPRRIAVYPISLKADLNALRRIGQAAYEIQCLSPVAFASSIFPTVSKYGTDTAGDTYLEVTPGGNAEVYPTIWFNVIQNDITGTPLFLFNEQWNRQYRKGYSPYSFDAAQGIQINLTGTNPALYKLDMQNRLLWRYDTTGATDVSSLLTTRAWFTLIPNVVNQLVYSNNGGTSSGNVWVQWSDAWL